MNTRIKELARKAGLIAPYGSDHEGLRDFDYRMFADLIVRECADLVDRSISEGGVDGRVVKEYFGVK